MSCSCENCNSTECACTGIDCTGWYHYKWRCDCSCHNESLSVSKDES